MKVLCTGAGGFLCSHLLEYVLANTDWDVIATDSFRSKGLTDRIAWVIGQDPAWRSRVDVVTHDLRAPFSEQAIMRMGPVDHVFAFASESDVPRSIAGPADFIRSNVEIALTTLEFCRRTSPRSVVWVSTDEVYGDGGGTPSGTPTSPPIPTARPRRRRSPSPSRTGARTGCRWSS